MRVRLSFRGRARPESWSGLVYIDPIYLPDISPARQPPRGDLGTDNRFEGGGDTIQRLTIQLPREVGDTLATLSSVSGEPVDAHVHRAITRYLDGDGRRAMVTGFVRRARDRHRGALDALSYL